jgi:hypothetical protein
LVVKMGKNHYANRSQELDQGVAPFGGLRGERDTGFVHWLAPVAS